MEDYQKQRCVQIALKLMDAKLGEMREGDNLHMYIKLEKLGALQDKMFEMTIDEVIPEEFGAGLLCSEKL